MPLNRHVKVPMPTEGTVRSRTGRMEVFKVLETFRKNGKPDNRRRCIGQYDEASGMLIPNNAYYEYYGDDAEEAEATYDVSVLPDEHSISAPGSTWLVSWILESIGVTGILKEVFGERTAAKIVLVAAYMVSRGNIMMYTSDWCETNVIGQVRITTQSTSSLFESLDFSQRMAFFVAWVKLRAQTEYFAYDVTSFSTLAKAIIEAERGYNRDKEKLPQINMALHVGQTSGLPVFYVTYQGSIVDKSHLKYMMAFNDELGITGVSFVLDAGFCSTANLDYMHSKGYEYIVAVQIKHKATRGATGDLRTGFDSLEYFISESVRGKSVKGTFYGVQATMHVYYDTARRDRQDNELMRAVAVAESELAQLVEGQRELESSETRKYSRYFDLEMSAGVPVGFSRNFGKINELARYHGYFCFLSNSSLSAAEALAVYRHKDTIEKAFDEVKNYTDMSRLHTHNSDTTDGKLFCAFIGLIASMHMQAKLGGLMDDRNLTKEKVILELEKMKVVQNNKKRRQYSPLTKLQKDILEQFGLSENDFANYLKG